MKFGISTLLIIVGCIAVVCWVTSEMMPHYGIGLHVNRVPMDSSCPLKKLPAAASNVAYHYGGGRNPNTFYEFDIDESDFLNWIDSLSRFNSVPDEPDATNLYNHNIKSTKYHPIADGYFYEWMHPTDGDCGEHIAYDKSNGRAYYQYDLF